MRQYRYKSLSHKDYAIRVLQLLPSSDKSSILRGKLIEYLFEDIDATNHASDMYEALSYVWGGEKKPKSIIITDNQNDGNQEVDLELPITQNLHDALLRLRHRQFPRILWVDAVCIDQTNDEEKEHQIQLMPVIYVRAQCVLVWLGEAQDHSDMVLESIQTASRSFLHLPSNDTPTTQSAYDLRQAVLNLLSRPWFSRMWILQEIGAARHVAILCGSTEIEGHAFSLGLDSLMKAWDIPLCSVTFLMRGAVFRPRRLSKKQARFSLDICSLSELIDQFNTLETTIRHDKVYALLGMSSDDVSAAGLDPDYKLGWEELMRRFVKFLLGHRVSIDIVENTEVAIIKGKGCLLGLVSSIKSTQGWETEVNIIIRPTRDSPETDRERSTSCYLPSLPNPIKQGDVICLLEGAQKPIIIRYHKGHFAVVMIGAVPKGKHRKDLSDLVQPTRRFSRDLMLTWGWGNCLVESQDAPAYDLTRSSNKSGLASRLDDFTYLWDAALLLRDVISDKQAEKMLNDNEATKECKAILGTLNQCIPPEDLSGLTPLAFAAKKGYAELAGVLLAEDRNSLHLEDRNGRMPLSHAAENGHVAFVRLLLESGQPDVNARDRDGRSPLSWAAIYGHEDVVKTLLETDHIDVNSKSSTHWTALHEAACNGHEGVLKLLLETDHIDVNSKTSADWTALHVAIECRHEGVVKLLLGTDQIDVNSKDVAGWPLLHKAAANGDEGVVKLLLEMDQIDVNAVNPSGQNLFGMAAEARWEGILNLLLKAGQIDINALDLYRRTALHMAAKEGYEVIVKTLLDNKADADPLDLYGRTPLSYAEENGHKAIIKVLRGEDVDYGDLSVSKEDAR